MRPYAARPFLLRVPGGGVIRGPGIHQIHSCIIARLQSLPRCCPPVIILDGQWIEHHMFGCLRYL